MSDNTRYDNRLTLAVRRAFLLGGLAGVLAVVAAWVASQIWADHVLLESVVRFLSQAAR